MKTSHLPLFTLLYGLPLLAQAQVSYTFEYKIESSRTNLKKNETTTEDLGWTSIKSNADLMQVEKHKKKHPDAVGHYILDFKNRFEITVDSLDYLLEELDSVCAHTNRVLTETKVDDIVNGQPCYVYESEGLLKEKIWVNKKVKNNPLITQRIFGGIINDGNGLVTQPIIGQIEKIELSYENGKSIRKEIYTLNASSDQPVTSIKLPWLDDTKRPAIRCYGPGSGESAYVKGLITYQPPSGMGIKDFEKYLAKMQALYLSLTGKEVRKFECMSGHDRKDIMMGRTEITKLVNVR